MGENITILLVNPVQKPILRRTKIAVRNFSQKVGMQEILTTKNQMTIIYRDDDEDEDDSDEEDDLDDERIGR